MKLLQPIRSEKIWGYEDWLASTHKDGLQKDFLELAGDYPLLVKVIQANDTLSVQVHPDDKTALLLEGAGSRGKTECWYILDCEKGARLIAGLKDGCTKDQIEQAIKDNTLQDLMNSVEVKKGDFIFIPAGTVHAIGGKIRLMEEDEYINTVCDFMELLPPDMVIQRLAGNGKREIRIQPRWLGKKLELVGKMEKEFERRGTKQGSKFNKE